MPPIKKVGPIHGTKKALVDYKLSFMQTMKEQLQKKCIHFNGIGNKECKAGVNYDTFRTEKPKPFKFPCLQQGGECPKAQFLTPEEAEAQERELNEMATAGLSMMLKAKQYAKETKQPTGNVPCDCGGQLKYVVSSYNGHIWGRCSSCGIAFNE